MCRCREKYDYEKNKEICFKLSEIFQRSYCITINNLGCYECFDFDYALKNKLEIKGYLNFKTKIWHDGNV